MAIDYEKLLAAIDAKAETAYGGEQDSAMGRHRASLIESYLGMNVQPAPEGRSQVVDRSSFETVHTMLPSLVRIFSGSSDEVGKFMPVGPEDEPAAEQTTAYINHLLTQKNPWEQFCADWILDALTLPTAYALVYWDDAEHRERETYEGQTPEQLAVLLKDESVQVLQHDQQPDQAQDEANAQQYQQIMQQHMMLAQQAMMQAQQTGMPPQMPPAPPPPEPAFLHDVVLERVDSAGRLKICVIPPEHTIVGDDTPDWTLEKASYFEYREEKTISDLRSMGFDVSDDISDSTDINDYPEDSARDRLGENGFLGDEGTGAGRKVVVRTAWVKADAEDDEVRLYYVLAVGRTILHAEPVSRIHAVSMTAQPMAHRHPGMSVVDMVKESQDIKTAIKRGALDNLYLSNNGRFAISDKVNLDDFLDSRPGSVVRLFDGALPGEGHVFPLTHPFMFDKAIVGLEYFDQDRQNISGANRYFSGTDAGALNKTATGTMALQNMAAQRVEHVARMMSPAFETVFSIAQELIAKHQNKADVIKLRGEWVNVDPTAWKTRRDVRISVGVGAGNKESMLASLNTTIQMQIAFAQAQLPVVTPENLYNALSEQAKLQGHANPDKFWSDPAKQPPKPQQPPPEVMIEQMRLQAKQQSDQAQMQMDSQKAQQDAQMEREKAASQLLLEQQKAEQTAALEKYKADLQAQTALQVEQLRLGQQVQIKGAEMEYDKQKHASDQAVQVHLADQEGARQAGDKQELVKHIGELAKEVKTSIEGKRAVGLEKVKDDMGRMIGARVKRADGSIDEVRIN